MSKRFLIVEAGNTVTDFAVTQNGSCLVHLHVPTATLKTSSDVTRQVVPLHDRFPGMEAAGVCSVVPALTALVMSALEDCFPGPVIEISASLRLPFTLEYYPPGAIGADRIALLAYAADAAGGRPVIAVDAGTAITVDVLDAEGHYTGGMILPGIDLSCSALNQGTARLPLVKLEKCPPLLGRSTEGCIQSGVFWGCVHQIEGILDDITTILCDDQEQEIPVIMTGGSGRLIEPLIHHKLIFQEHAVLFGAWLLTSMNSI
ncbi:MAG: type III pantothenate kinase [Prosthecochloris sp.]|nr:type III pantothenate kinase [Prosthecochloris sp.]